MQGKSYTIDILGFFRSNRNSETTIVEITEKLIPKGGDVLLQVYCTIGVLDLTFGDCIRYQGESSYDLFEGGLPFLEQYESHVCVHKSESNAKVYALFEKYDTLDFHNLATYSAPYNTNYGVKVRDPINGKEYQINKGQKHGFALY